MISRLPLLFLVLFSFASFASGASKSSQLCQMILDGKVRVEPTTVAEIFNDLERPYVRQQSRRIVGTDKPVEVVVIDESDYSKELEKLVKANGYLGIAIRSPSNQAIIDHPDYLLAPEWIRWAMHTPASEEAWLASMSGDARRQMKKKLAASASIRTEVKPMTLAGYDRWQREMFVPYMAKRDGGIAAWGPVDEFVKEAGIEIDPNIPFLENKPKNWFEINFFKNDENGVERFVGAMMIQWVPADKMIRIRNAAYEPKAREENELALRGTALLADLARMNNIEYMSYGDDLNFYGVDMLLGLARFKAAVGMTPVLSIPWAVDAKTSIGKFNLVKILNPDQVRTRQDGKDAGLFFFAVPGDGQERVDRLAEVLSKVMRTDRSYEDRMKDMQALTVGLQICMQPGSDKCKVPTGMTLHRTEAENITVPLTQSPQ